MAITSKEIPQGTPDEAPVKLSDVKRKYQIEVPEHLLKEFGDVLVSKKHIRQIENGKLNTEELSKLKLEQLRGHLSKNSIEKVGSDIEKSNKIEKKGDNEKTKSGKEADEKFDAAINKITKGNPKAKEILSKTRAVNSQVIEKAKDISEGFSWEKLENFPVIGFIFKFLAAMLGTVLGFGKGLKSLFGFGDKVKEKLTSDEIRKTKEDVSEKIKTDILGKFGKIHPALKEKLEKKVEDPDFISGENIRELKEISDKKGKLEIKDIKYVLSEEEYTKIGEELKNDPEVYEAIKLKYEAQLVNSISKEYGINLQGDKRAELKKLIQEKGAAEKIDLLQFYTRIENGETITLGELTVGLFDEAAEATWFTMSLLGKGVVTADKFVFNIVEGGTKLLFGLAGLGMKNSIELDDFKGSLERMNEKERILVLGLLYRKGGILFELLGHITSFASTQVIEGLSSTSVTKWELLKASGTSDVAKKMKTFGKLEKMLGGDGGMDILNGALKNQKLINRNNKIIQILEKAEKTKGTTEATKVTQIKKLLKQGGFNIDDIKHLESVDEIRSTLSKIIKTNKFTIGHSVKGYFVKDIRARQIDFYRNIDGITNYQSKIIAGENKIIRLGTGKLGETLHALQIGKNAERVLLEAKTAKGVITKLEALKRLSLEAPDLLRSICRGLPEIAVMGLAAGTREENESIMEAMIKVAPFLTRIVGPGMMIFSLGGAYRDGKLQWVNVAEAGLGTIFLGLDTAAALKIFGEHGFSGKSALEIGKFVVKPVTAPIDVGVRTVNFMKSGSQVFKAEGSWKNFGKEVGKKTLNGMKNIKGKKLALMVGVALAIGYGVKEVWDEDFDEKYERLVEEGILDPKTGEINDFEKAKIIFKGLNKSEKEDFAKIIFMTDKSALLDPNYLDFEIQEDNSLLVSTTANKTIGKWVITSDIKSSLELLGVKNIDFQNNTPKKQ